VNVLIESAHNFLNGIKPRPRYQYVSEPPAITEEQRYATDIALLNRALDGIALLSLNSPSMLTRCWILCRSASLPYTIPEYEEGLDWEWVETRNAAITAVIYAMDFPNDVHIKLHGGVLEIDWTKEMKEVAENSNLSL
jgi:hypothetical protein